MGRNKPNSSTKIVPSSNNVMPIFGQSAWSIGTEKAKLLIKRMAHTPSPISPTAHTNTEAMCGHVDQNCGAICRLSPSICCRHPNRQQPYNREKQPQDTYPNKHNYDFDPLDIGHVSPQNSYITTAVINWNWAQASICTHCIMHDFQLFKTMYCFAKYPPSHAMLKRQMQHQCHSKIELNTSA